MRVKARKVCFRAVALSDRKFAIVLSSGVCSSVSHMISRFLVVSACSLRLERMRCRYPYM